MKNILLCSLICLTLFACKDTNKKNKTERNTAVAQAEIHQELYGSWVGDFLDAGSEGYEGDYDYIKKLNIIIKKITKDTVIAQSIVSGNNRPLFGKMSEDGSKITFILDEPGTHKYDGRFEIELVGDTLKGKWSAYKTELKWPEKEYKLIKRQFVYNPNLMLPTEASYVDWNDHKFVEKLDTLEDGKVDTAAMDFYRSASDQIFKLNASAHLLKEQDLKNLRKLDLQILKNTIFARHGYAFKKDTYRQFFDPVEWYIPISSNVDDQLTSIENKNIKLIDRFTKYAEDNYDTFGR